MELRKLAVACGLTAALAACGGGGGGGPVPTLSATPTSTGTPRPISTPTATAEPGVVVSRVFPPLGFAGGQTSVLVEGTGFDAAEANTVTFGDAEATNCIALGDRKISCLTPSGESGSSVAVSVSNQNGTGVLNGAYTYAGGGSSSVLNVELSGAPSVAFDDQIGTTTVVSDYLVRDSDGVPVDESNLNITMYVDGEQLGAGGRFNESVLDRNSQELDLNVLLLLVLDASYSLQQFNPPQFQPMLASAQSVVDSGTQIWSKRGGRFDWNIVWFDELISRPDPDYADTFRIANIPAPVPGNFTKLYSAVSNALELSESLYRQGVAAGPRDRHVLVVFTDGQDNLSSFDNRNVSLQGHLANGDPYPRVGWKATGPNDLFQDIAAHDAYPTNLTVHTIALGVSCEQSPQGACFDGPALRQIAQVGFGQQLSSTNGVGGLFDQIEREFTTLQSSGAKVALGPGDYEFRLVAELRNHRASGEVRFTFRVDQHGAELLGF